MNLPDAIARMLEGVVMVDNANWPHRFSAGVAFGSFEIFGILNKWTSIGTLAMDGWRPATPEELKEIEKQ